MAGSKTLEDAESRIIRQARLETDQGAEGPSPPTAICLSGGGIRSAVFSMGVLEGLRRRMQRESFDYLSTVSGGGFAGAWSLSRPEPSEDRSRYLDETSTPGLRGPLELVFVYLGKWLLYALFMIPALAAMVLALVGTWRLISSSARSLLGWEVGADPSMGSIALAVAVGLIVFMALLQSRAGRWLAKYLLLLALLSAGAHYLAVPAPGKLPAGTALPGAGAVLALAVWLLGSSSRLAQVRWIASRLGTARLVRVVALLCVLLIGVVVCWLLVVIRPLCEAPLDALRGLPLPGGLSDDALRELPLPGGLSDDALLALALGGLAAGVGLLPARWFSVADFYRRRIRKAFVGDPCPAEAPRAWSRLLRLLFPRCFVRCNRARPLHLINAALNSPGAGHRHWDERLTEPFVWSPLGYAYGRKRRRGSGSGSGSGRTEVVYATAQQGREAAPDLALALATSAAVAGPRMGAYTAKAVGYLLVLLNLRLGRWFRLGGPRPFVPRGTLLGEVLRDLGLAREPAQAKKCRWVYLSDGGHFENLGLYEVIRRRCGHVVVVDGSCDPRYQFSDLANAVRKVRTDFKASIEIDGLRWTEDGAVLESPARNQRQRVYGGTIRYLDDEGQLVERGELVYIKAALVGDEPADVAGYADLHPQFPHESTADQWFSEAQYESYFRLGEFTVKSALDQYEDAKALWRTSPAEKRVPYSAEQVVGRLREAGMIVGRPELRPTHGGIVLAGEWPSKRRRFLLVESSDGGAWVLPKGHIERGERPGEAGARELLEEAGYRWQGDWRRWPVVIDRFQKGEETVRVVYTVVDAGKLSQDSRSGKLMPRDCAELTCEEAAEERRHLWVTPGEYEHALTKHRSVDKKWKEALRADEDDENKVVKTLGEACLLIPGQLWVLEEADRKLDRWQRDPIPG